MGADLILFNGRITTLASHQPEVAALAIHDGRVLAAEDVMRHAGPATKRIDLRRRRAIPGLVDSHTHIIRQFALEAPRVTHMIAAERGHEPPAHGIALPNPGRKD